MSRLRVAPGCVAAALLACGCGNGANGGDADAGSGGDSAAGVDASPSVDALLPLVWVDFSATGCADFGADGGACAGSAPLELRFAATSPSPITDWIWDFGDGAGTSHEPTPVHRYELPGVYDVELVVGGPGGTARSDKPDFVTVSPAPLGGACRVDLQCGELDCVCDDATVCPGGLSAGMCSRTCAGGECPEPG